MTDESVLAASVPVRPAATVMLVRDGADGLEVFMLQRSHSSSFARSQYVFPGGRVDDADAAAVYEPISDGVTDASASARLGLEAGGLAWLVAAIRECFEEAGVLLARKSGDDDVITIDEPDVVDEFERARHRIHDGDLDLATFCAEQDLQLLTDRIHFIDHWVTPVGERRRFDTRFFVAAAPSRQTPFHDSSETIASLWTTPTAALEQWERGDLQMFPPTVASLNWLAQFADSAAAIAAAQSAPLPTPIVPKLVVDDDNHVIGILRNDDDGYAAATVPTYLVNGFRN